MNRIFIMCTITVLLFGACANANEQSREPTQEELVMSIIEEALADAENAESIPTQWDDAVDSYFSASKIINESNIKFDNTIIEAIEPEYIAELFELNIGGGGQNTVKYFIENYSPGSLMKDFVISTHTYAVPVKYWKASWENQDRGDAVFLTEGTDAYVLTDYGRWDGLGCRYRTDPFFLDTLKNEQYSNKLLDMGFSPDTTKACAMAFPYIWEDGILFYDGVHEAYMPITTSNLRYMVEDHFLNYFPEDKIISMEEIVIILDRHINQIVPEDTAD